MVEHVIRSIGLALAATICLHAAEKPVVPDSIMRGILMVESSSYYEGQEIVWINHGRDRDSLGPFQMRELAWKQIAKPGEQFSWLGEDTVYAEDCAVRYLLWLRVQSKDWNETIEAYNSGPHHKSPVYLAKVLKAAQ